MSEDRRSRSRSRSRSPERGNEDNTGGDNNNAPPSENGAPAAEDTNNAPEDEGVKLYVGNLDYCEWLSLLVLMVDFAMTVAVFFMHHLKVFLLTNTFYASLMCNFIL